MKQFNQLHLKSRLLAVFGIVLAAVAGLSAFTYHTTQNALKNSHWVDHTHKVIAEAEGALAGLVNMETGLRGFMVTGKDEYLEPYNSGRTNYHAKLDSLSKLTSDNAEQVRRWNEIHRLAGKWETDFAEKGIELRRQVNTDGAPFTQLGVFTETGGGKAIFDSLRSVFAEAIEAEKILLDRRNRDNAASSNLLLNVTLWGSLSVIAVGIVLALAFARSLVKPLQEVAKALETGATEVNAAASQVATSSQSLAEGSSEQAASLEETSSSLEEMSSMTKRNAENSRKANELAKLARSAAEKGVEDMQEMNAAMSGIKSSSDDIAKIIKTIDEIAFQTNILALNAAVEAARAGEAGAGFAVVADEVRNLAQRCAQAARETSSKIEGAIVKSTEGVAISSRVSEALAEIVRRSREVDALVAEVAGASVEQSQGISQVNLAVSQMDKVTQANASSSEESAAASEELKSQSAGLHEVVADLLALIEGRSDAEPVSRAQAAVEDRRRAPAPTTPAPRTTLVRPESTPPVKTTTSAVRDGEFMDF